MADPSIVLFCLCLEPHLSKTYAPVLPTGGKKPTSKCIEGYFDAALVFLTVAYGFVRSVIPIRIICPDPTWIQIFTVGIIGNLLNRNDDKCVL